MTTVEPLSQQQLTPSTKVAAGGIAGAVTVIVLFILDRLHVIVPADVGSAITVLLTFLSGYVVRERRAAPLQSNAAPRS
jgi:hypothetical protein